MYSRVFVVGKNRLGEADYLYRMCTALRAKGHAVERLDSWARGSIDPCMVDAVAAGFAPTLVLWDTETVSADEAALGRFRALGCAVCELIRSPHRLERARRELFDVVIAPFQGSDHSDGALLLSLPLVPDDGYIAAKSSSLEKRRRFLLVVQECSATRRQAIDRALCAFSDGSLRAFDSSWGEGYVDPTASRGAFEARCAKYAIFFDDDSLSPADVAFRFAEGCIVLAEESLLNRRVFAPFAHVVEPFTGPDDLHDAIARCEGDPSIAAKALARERDYLAREQSLGDAWDKVLKSLDNALQLREFPILSQEKPTKEFVVFGWFGARNFGDDMLLDVALHKIRARFPESVVSVIGACSDVVEHDYGLYSVTPDKKHEISEMLRNACSLSFYGGLLFDDPMSETAGITEMLADAWIEPTGQAGICLLAWMNGVPQLFLGIGAGPLELEAPRLAVRTMGLAGARFLPRDDNTCSCLAAAGVPQAQIEKKSDLVFCLANDRELFYRGKPCIAYGLTAGTYFIVALRSWNLNPPDFSARIACAIDTVFESTGVVPVFVPFDQDDVAIHNEVLAHMKHADKAVAFGHRLGKDDLLSLISASHFAFAMRLHCSVLHHVLGKPAFGLNYNDKIGAHFDLMGQGGLLFSLDAQPEDMARTITRELSRFDEDASEELMRRVDAKASSADEAFEELFAFAERRADEEKTEPAGKFAFYPRSRSLLAENLDAREAELNHLRIKYEEAERQIVSRESRLNEMQASTAWKVGRALTALPRAIKDFCVRAR